MGKCVLDYLPREKILAQLAEEASELAQAALKLRRALDGTNPTPYFYNARTKIESIELKKLDRWLSRLKEAENEHTV